MGISVPTEKGKTMIIKIDVPDTTVAISVSALYQAEDDGISTMTSRCFAIVDGEAKDGTGSNKVLQEKDNERKAD